MTGRKVRGAQWGVNGNKEVFWIQPASPETTQGGASVKTPEFWLNLQTHDLEREQTRLKGRLDTEVKIAVAA
jgi:hypothetical protein